MNTAKLVTVLRDKAEEIQKLEDLDDRNRLDVAELLRVLARMADGKDVYRAFGAPGDWGYGTPIGDALNEAYSPKRPNDPSSATRPTRASDCNLDAMAGFAAAHG